MKRISALIFLMYYMTGLLAQVSHKRADSLYLAGDYQEALLQYKKDRKNALAISTDSIIMWDWLIFRVRNRLGDFENLKAIEEYTVKHKKSLYKDLYFLKILDELSYAYINQRMAPKAIEVNREILHKYQEWQMKDPIIYSNALKSLSFSFTVIGDLDSSEHYIHKNLAFLKKNMKPDDVEVGYAHYYLGIMLEEKVETKEALENLLIAKEIIAKKNGKDHPHIGTISDAIARCYEAEGQFDEAEKSYHQSIRIFKKLNLESNLVMTYVNLSKLETSLGKSGNSKVYLEEAKRLSVKNDRYVYPMKGYILKGLASYEMNHNRDYKKARQLLLEALKDQEDNDDEGIGLAHSYYAVAYASNLDKDTTDVFYYLDKAREIFEQYKSATPHNYINVINDYGTAYFNRKEYDKALEYYYQSLDLYLKALGESHIHVSENYSLIADCYREMGQPEKADSIIIVGSEYLFEKGYNQSANFPINHLNLFHSRLEIEFKKANTAERYLLLFDRASNVRYTSVFRRSSLINAEDLSFYGGSADKLNNLLLEQSQKAYSLYKRDIFYAKFADFANTYKSNLISNKINEEKLLVASGIDSASIRQYKTIRDKARHLELISAESTSENLDSINQEKTKMNSAMTSWQSNVERKFNITLGQLIEPKYKSGSKALERYLCSEKTTIILIVADGEKYFLYAMGCHKIERKGLGSIDSMNRKIELFTTSIKTLKDKNDLLPQCYDLYVDIFSQLDISEANRLIILPDGLFNSLNFEILISKKPDQNTGFKNAEWLCKKYEIFYAQYLPELSVKKSTKFTGKNLLVMTPDFVQTESSQKRMTLGYPLQSTPWTKELCLYLHQKYEARLLAGKEANLSNWEKHRNNYSYIHIGTHALMDSDQPLGSKLLMGSEENDIDFYHILQSGIQAELVVLGACETGLGKDNHANDIYSLAQAFQYSGVKSVIQSLWKIDDETSNEIFEKFYHYKKEGFESARALRMAKLDYLDSHDGEKLNPYYWAGLVYISNEVYDKPGTHLWWIAAVLAGLFAAFFIFFKKKLQN